MKKLPLSIAFILMAALFSACSSSPKVARVSSDTQIDLSGRWNDADARIVSNSLINDCLNSPRVRQFIQQFSSGNNGNLPACLVGRFENASSEHIDTSIISKAMEIAIVNSGKMDFVAGGDTRAEIRSERADQQSNASEETASRLANETGAVLILTGSVKSIVDRAGNRTIRSYFVNAELTNIETNTRLWMGENNEIKKDIRQSSYRP
jgi:uncharacterized protein (TIGR02722 family)